MSRPKGWLGWDWEMIIAWVMSVVLLAYGLAVVIREPEVSGSGVFLIVASLPIVPLTILYRKWIKRRTQLTSYADIATLKGRLLRTKLELQLNYVLIAMLFVGTLFVHSRIMAVVEVLREVDQDKLIAIERIERARHHDRF